MYKNNILNLLLVISLFTSQNTFSYESSGSRIIWVAVLSGLAVVPLLVSHYFCDNSDYYFAKCTLAIIHNEETDLRYLLSQGIDVNLKTSDGWSLAHAWVIGSYCNERILSLLVDSGLNLNMCDNDGHSPLHIAEAKGNEQAVKLLLKYGAHVSDVSI